MENNLKYGDFVRYPPYGICKIVGMQEKKFDIAENKLYFILQPVKKLDCTVYVSANQSDLLRKMVKVMTKEQLDNLIIETASDKLEWIADSKARIRKFNAILNSNDAKSILQLISLLNDKSHEMINKKKALSPGDTEILRKAKYLVDNDFAFVLGVDEDDVGRYIKDKIGIT